MTASDNEYQRVVQRVTKNESEWQQMTMNDSEWQKVVGVKTAHYTWKNGWLQYFL